MTVRTYKYRQYDGQEISKKRAKDEATRATAMTVVPATLYHSIKKAQG